MKLSNDTLTVLKNFAEINPNLTIAPGNIIKTVHTPPTIYGEAQINELFPTSFGIYDLKEFLATISMFKNPELTFTEDCVDIVDSEDPTIRTKYWSANRSILTKVPTFVELPDPEVVFTVSDLNFKRIERASATLKLYDVVFKGGNGKIVAVVCDRTEATKNSFTVCLDNEYTGDDFEVFLKQEKLMMIGGDYKCSIIARRILKCEHTSRPLQYIISLDVDTN